MLKSRAISPRRFGAQTPVAALRSLTARYGVHIVTLLATAALISQPTAVSGALSSATGWFLSHFGWLVLLASTGSVVVCVALAVGPSGNARLGGPQARPEFSLRAWLMMLFAAGMGAGLVFWGASEPLIHLLSPPPGVDAVPGTGEAARAAMVITLLHWALHPWAIYAIGAIGIGYFGFASGGLLRPSVGVGVKGPAARLVDFIALLGVTFAIVASLGQGVIQITAGVEAVTGGARGGLAVGLVILVVLFAFYTASVTTGLQRGIKWLSEANMVLAGVLLVFVLLAGPAHFIVEITVSALGDYLAAWPALSLDLRPYADQSAWMGGWTQTYFLWWAAWIPFVGVFIARISYGRTIREVVLGVILVPSVFTLLWFGVMGGAAIQAHLSGGADFGVADFDKAQRAVFALLDTLPMAVITQAAATILVFIFLATSADSGAYVLAMLSYPDERDPHLAQRLFWGAALAALTAGALLTTAGSSNLGEAQTIMRALAVTGGVPMIAVMVVLGVRLVVELKIRAPRASVHAPPR